MKVSLFLVAAACAFLNTRTAIAFVSTMLLVTGTLPVVQGQHLPGTNDAGFNMADYTFGAGGGFNYSVNSIAVQNDGKTIVGGAFTSYNSVTNNRIVRLHTNGYADESFHTGVGFNNEVLVVVPQSDGKVVVGGAFTSYNGTLRRMIARLHADGSLDTTFDPGTGSNHVVRAITVQDDGKLIIVGEFTAYNGFANRYIARLNTDGSLDESFKSGNGFNRDVQSVALQPDGKLIVVGLFNTYNDVPCGRIARLNTDGSLDDSFNSGTGFDQVATTIALQDDGKLLVGGWFTAYDSVACHKMARLNPDGSLDDSFNSGPEFNGGIETIVMQRDGKVIVGGNFTTYNGMDQKYIARFNTDGSLDDTYHPGAGLNNVVKCLALESNNMLVVGGVLSAYNGISRGRIVRFNSNGVFDYAFNPKTGFDQYVNCIALQSDGKMVVGGAFTIYNNTSRYRIARLHVDGSLDESFNPGTGFNDYVTAIAIQSDGKLLVGGEFSSYNGTPCIRIARLHTDGSLDESFNPGYGFGDGLVRALTLQSDGKVVVGGDFSFFNGTSRHRIARLHTDGSLDESFNFGTNITGFVYSIAIQSNGKIMMGGYFRAHQNYSNIVRLHTDGSLDTSFDSRSGFNDIVYSIIVQKDNKVLVGGGFSNYNGEFSKGIARLHPNGSFDNTFKSGNGFSSTVRSIALQGDGKVVAGGIFSSFNNTPRSRIARLDANGSLDESFKPGIGLDDAVNAIALQPDGKVIVGGYFTSFDKAVRNKIVRLHNDVLPLSTANDLQSGPEVLLYPNPTQNDIHLLFAGAAALVGGAKLVLHDAMGRQVLFKEVTAAEAQAGVKLATTGLKGGVYFLNISTKDNTLTKRLVLAQ